MSWTSFCYSYLSFRISLYLKLECTRVYVLKLWSSHQDAGLLWNLPSPIPSFRHMLDCHRGEFSREQTGFNIGTKENYVWIFSVK